MCKTGFDLDERKLKRAVRKRIFRGSSGMGVERSGGGGCACDFVLAGPCRAWEAYDQGRDLGSASGRDRLSRFRGRWAGTAIGRRCIGVGCGLLRTSAALDTAPAPKDRLSASCNLALEGSAGRVVREEAEAAVNGLELVLGQRSRS